MRTRDCTKGHYYGKLSVLLITCLLFAIIMLFPLSKLVYAFQENLHLSSPGVPSFLAQVITVAGTDRVYAAWSGQLEDGYSDIFLSASTDGINFGERKNISSTPGADSLNVQLVGLGFSNVYVVWQDSTSDSPGILFANSTDGGNSFGTPISVSGNSFFADSPQIAVTSSGDVYVVWHDNVDGNDEIFFAAKPHDQNSFGQAKNVSNSPTGLSANPQITVSSDGTVFLVWTDNASGDSEILFAKSTDGGNSFGTAVSTPIFVSNNDGESLNPRLVGLGASNVYVVWQDSTSDSPGILFANSTDGGNSFGTPISVSGNSFFADSPQIAVTSSS